MHSACSLFVAGLLFVITTTAIVHNVRSLPRGQRDVALGRGTLTQRYTGHRSTGERALRPVIDTLKCTAESMRCSRCRGLKAVNRRYRFTGLFAKVIEPSDRQTDFRFRLVDVNSQLATVFPVAWGTRAMSLCGAVTCLISEPEVAKYEITHCARDKERKSGTPYHESSAE